MGLQEIYDFVYSSLSRSWSQGMGGSTIKGPYSSPHRTAVVLHKHLPPSNNNLWDFILTHFALAVCCIMSARDLFKPCPQPKTELGRYRILSSTAGVRVSPLVLGGMSFGTAWAEGMGSVDEQQAFKLLDAYNDAGGNFIDTSNHYQSEQSEQFIGKWMSARGNRDLMFVATKFTTKHFLKFIWSMETCIFLLSRSSIPFNTVEDAFRNLSRRLYLQQSCPAIWLLTSNVFSELPVMGARTRKEC